MAKRWQDPLEVAPPKNTLLEVMGIPNAEMRGAKKQYKEWRVAAFMANDGQWYLPEISAMKYTPLLNVFFNEVYRWRDLRP